MFGIGAGEIMFVLVIALIIFGPGKLPEIGRTLGRFMGEVRKATSEIQETINSEIDMDDDKPQAGTKPTWRPAPPRPEPVAEEPEQTQTDSEDPDDSDDPERAGADQPH